MNNLFQRDLISLSSQFPRKVLIKEYEGLYFIINPKNYSYIICNKKENDLIKIIYKHKNGNHDLSFISNDKLDSIQKHLCLIKYKIRHSKYFDISDYKNDKLAIDKIVINLTNQCNLDCSYCFRRDINSNYVCEINYDEIVNFISNLVTINDFQIIELTGGEPFLYSKILELVAFLKQNLDGQSIEITTNGQFISRDIKAVLNNSNVNLKISLNAASENVYVSMGRLCFDRLLKNIQHFKNITKTSLVFVIFNENYNDIKRNLITLLEKIDSSRQTEIIYTYKLLPPYKSKSIHPISERQIHEIDKLFRKIEDQGWKLKNTAFENYCKKFHCGLCRAITIEPNGDIFPCMDACLKNDLKIVNLSSINNNIKDCLFNFVKGYEIDKLEFCKNCDIRYLCGGICRLVKDKYNSHECSIRRKETFKTMMLNYYQNLKNSIVQNG